MQAVSPSRGTLRFSDFEVDLRAGELRKQGVKVRLQEQPFQILQALLERPGEVVTRDELRQRIWPADTFVDFDHGLYNAIKRLREALGDSAETPRYIETLPKRGYRFIAVVDRNGNNSRHPVAVPPSNEISCPDPELDADRRPEDLSVSGGTKQPGSRFGDALPVLNQHSRWVRLAAVLFVLASVTLITFLTLREGHRNRMHDPIRPAVVVPPTEPDSSDHPPAVQLSGTGGPLEVTEVRFTDDGEFDVMVRNLGATDLIIHEISIRKVQEPRGMVFPILGPSAKYHIPVDDIPVGKTKSLWVSHVVRAGRADRFLIALDSTTIYLLEVTLSYNRGQKVSFTMETWH